MPKSLSSYLADTILTAWIAFIASGTALISLAALHIFNPEFNPSNRMISEYALGGNSWLVSLMFLANAVSFAALFLAIRYETKGTMGKIGLYLLLLGALGSGMAAFFDVSTNLHGFAALIGIPGTVFATLFLSLNLAKNNHFKSKSVIMLLLGIIPILSLVVMTIVLLAGIPSVQQTGTLPQVGWPNRILVVSYSLWVTFITWTIIQLPRHK